MQKTIYVSSDTAKQPCFPCIQDALDSIADDNTKPYIIKIPRALILKNLS